MAFHTVQNLKDGVAGLIEGTTLNSVTDVDRVLERAAATTLQKADIPEASGATNYMFYNGVFNYAAPPTIFGGALIDIQPQGVTRTPNDYVYRQPIELFDRTKCFLPNGVAVTFEHFLGNGIMRVAQVRAPLRAVLDTMSQTTGWVASGTASGLAVDSTVYYQSPASLRFNVATGVGTLTKSIVATDLSDYQGVGVAFLAIYTPSGTDLTSLSIKIGSSAVAYTLITETDGFLGAWIANDWLLVAFDLSVGVDTGTPNYAAIDYIQVNVTAAAALTNFHAGGLWLSLPTPYTVLYQSDAIFLSGGELSQVITSDDDEIILNDAAYTIYEYECALAIAVQQGTPEMQPKIDRIEMVLGDPIKGTGLYGRYAANNPSEQLRQIGSYYDSNNQGY